MNSRSSERARNRRAPKDDNGDNGDAPSTKVRRERNRQAQHVFRVRKQAEQREKDRHIQKLESEIEQMGSIFFDLADVITRSEHARADAELMQTVRSSMKRVVRLADENAEQSMESSPSQTSTEPATGESSSATSAVEVSTLVGQVYEDINDNINDHRAIDASTILGSGMFSLTPGPQPNMFSGTLSNRIIQASLRYGYMILSSNPDISNEIVKSLFKFTLQHATREQVLLNMSWALGPGNWFIPILANHNFDGNIAKQVVKNIHAQKGAAQTIDFDLDAAPDKRAEICLNAVEVEKYIMTRSIGFIDEDVLELMIEDNDTSLASLLPSAYPQPGDYINLDVFFPAEQQREASSAVTRSPTRREPRKMRISQNRLVHNLAYISMCTSDGPGYPTDGLKQVIASSVIESY